MTITNFTELHAAVVATNQVIEYNDGWSNGTGYMDGAIYAKTDTLGLWAFTCPQGRKGLIIPTAVGNIVIFQRYTNSDVLVCNSHSNLRVLEDMLGISSAFSMEQLASLLLMEKWSDGYMFNAFRLPGDTNAVAHLVRLVIHGAELREKAAAKAAV